MAESSIRRLSNRGRKEEAKRFREAKLKTDDAKKSMLNLEGKEVILKSLDSAIDALQQIRKKVAGEV